MLLSHQNEANVRDCSFGSCGLPDHFYNLVYNLEKVEKKTLDQLDHFNDLDRHFIADPGFDLSVGI